MGQCNAGQREEKHGHTQALPELGPNNIAHIHFGIKISAPIESKSKRQETCGNKKTHINAVAESTYNRGQQDRKKAHRCSRQARPCCGIAKIRLQHQRQQRERTHVNHKAQ